MITSQHEERARASEERSAKLACASTRPDTASGLDTLSAGETGAPDVAALDARPLLRHLRARLPAQRAGDLVPAAGRRRGGGAARRVWEGSAHNWRAGLGTTRAARARGAPAPRGGRPGTSTPSSSATRATSTCPPPAGPRAAGRSSSTRSSRSPTRSSPTAGASATARCPARALRAVDRHALRAADLVVADTRANADHLAELADLAAGHCRGLPSSAPRSGSSRPGWAAEEPFTALFVGKLIPLHGVETILAAARLAPGLRFRIVGSGQLESLLEGRPANVEWVRWVEYEQLPQELHRAGCALGIFGTSDKALRVIPNKAFQALACGTPLVTADTPAARELLVDERERAARPAGRPDSAGGRAAPARSRSRARASPRRRRSSGLRGAGERGGPRRAMARSCSSGPGSS